MSKDNDLIKLNFIKRRLAIIQGMQFFCFFLLIGKLFKLQILDNALYKKKSDQNSRRLDFILPKRGNILDKNGKIIANNKQEIKVVFNKEKKNNNYIREITNVFKLITKYSNKEKEMLLSRLKKQINRSQVGVFVVAKNLPRKDLMNVKFNIPYFNHIEIEKYNIRNYNFGKHTSCLIGSVHHPQTINNLILKNNIDYKVGYSGIEKVYERHLGGIVGRKFNIINVVGKKVDEIMETRQIDGKDIKTTIDQRVQNYLSKIMEDKNGAVTLLDCNTGNIIAMCSTPNIDPNYLSRGMKDEDWEQLIKNNGSSGLFLNKNISSVYPAGSTFKIVSSIVGLMQKKIKPEEKFLCTGEYRIGNRIFHCWKHKYGGHGLINFNQALAQSCNCYFYHLSTILDPDDIYDMAVKLGFNQKLLTDFDEEIKGLIPNKQWKRKTYNQRWYPGDNANFILGQGFVNVTPLQLATMIAKIASNLNIKPNYLFNNHIQDVAHLGIDEDIMNIVRKGLFSVINEKYGVAYYTAKKKYQICGKTGTAQIVSTRFDTKDMLSGKIKKEKHDHALFVGYAPYYKPQYAVSVVVEHGVGGARMAVPIGTEILTKAIDIEKEQF